MSFDPGLDLGTALRTGFVTGFVFLAPLVVSIVVILFAYNWILGLIEPFLVLWLGEIGVVEQVISVISLLILVSLLGLVIRRWATDNLLETFDRVMEDIPIVSSIYSPTRQASTALIDRDNQFEHVALVEWPRSGLFTVGFVTDETPEAVESELDGESHYDVFVPMSPNPMGGFLAVVPESELTMTDLSVREGLEVVVTTGLQGESELQVEDLRQSIA